MTIEPAMTPSEDTTAAELALGVLDGAERAAALRRVIAEPDFAREVERWRDHFALLFAGMPEQAAPETVWPRIERQLSAPETTPQREVRWGNPWKPAALAASVAALVMTTVALRPVEAPPVDTPPVDVAAAPMIAAMALTDSGGASQPALYDAKSGKVRMPGPMPIPAGKDAQLWAIEGDRAPVPLGTFHVTGPGTYEAEAKSSLMIKAGTKLAISIEPLGGSPSGKPTGPIIASGSLNAV